MKKPEKPTGKKVNSQPKKSVEKNKQQPEPSHKERFDQLLDDSVFGVKKK